MAKGITGKGVSSLSRATDDSPSITLNSEVVEGPAGAAGRRISVSLDAASIAFLFSTLATTPAFRGLFRVVADTLDACEAGTVGNRHWDDLRTANEVQRAVSVALARNAV